MEKYNLCEHNNYTRYIIMKHQLESFYLIPVDQIVDSIMKETPTAKDEPSDLLEKIFKHIFQGAAHYYDFIDINCSHSFFNENYGDYKIMGLRQLIYLALLNNCILDDFLDELSYCSDPIEISAKNQPLIKMGIMNLIFQSNPHEHLKGEVNSQQFYNRKNIFMGNLNTDIYINKIIESLNIPDDAQKDKFSIRTLQYAAPAAIFLFAEDKATKFGKSLSNKKNVIQCYNSLAQKYYNVFLEPNCNADSTIDQLIFKSEMEAIFGFSFFRSISSSIEAIHNMPATEEKSLKMLEGQQFINIIQQIANLPLFFNKLLFYKYICHAFLASKSISYNYFEESAKEIATRIPDPQSEFYQVSTCQNLMNHFIQILSSLSIPLLYSLWKTVIHELINRKWLAEPKVDIYKKYLVNNYSSIVYDYSTLTDEDLLKFRTDFLFPKKKLNANRFCEYIKPKTDIQANTEKCISKNEPIFLAVSKYTKDIMQQLLLSYCKIDSLKEKRFPFFFLPKDECAAYSPLSRLISSLQLHPEHHSAHEYHKDDFLVDYRKILFKYLASI